MITTLELIDSLEPLNGRYFQIDDLPAYAKKVQEFAKSFEVRQANRLVAFVLFYDDRPEIYITMIWADPTRSRQGLATALMQQVISSSGKKNLRLEVHKDNPALSLYKRLGFQAVGTSGDQVRMLLEKKPLKELGRA